MTPEEYDQNEQELVDRAYQAGMIYARLRKLRTLKPYPAPEAIIRHEQERLDRIADRVSELLKQTIDYETREES